MHEDKKQDHNSSNITPEGIEEDAQQNLEKLKEQQGLFIVKPANKWIMEAKSRKIPGMLFDKFWFEGELCILFADTNLGKSVLAVQIADSISKGSSIDGFMLEANQQPILYFDFELSDKQIEGRYSENYTNHYKWSDYFYRVEINPESADFKEAGFNDFESYLYRSIEQSINQTEAKVLIIDNITYLKDETETAKFAMPLMKKLQSLKKQYELSILALAHTPKRDLSSPLTRNDLQGSKMLMNFCDSSFAIGESHADKNIRYLKQIKVRNSEKKYDANEVCLFQLYKSSNFLRFEYLNIGAEKEHLKQQTNEERDQVIGKVKEMSDQGYSQRQIAEEFGISLGSVNKYINM